MWNVDSKGNCAVWEIGGIWQFFSVLTEKIGENCAVWEIGSIWLFSQFSCGPKTTFKNFIHFKRKKIWNFLSRKTPANFYKGMSDFNS